MKNENAIGFACAYTPLALIHAAGFTPYRVLPVGDNPDQAGRLLHDNLCPHVKRILDRAMSNDLPDLSGMIFMNSCDAMRRLADAWRIARPEIKSALVDLPVTTAENDIHFLTDELKRTADLLTAWGGKPYSPEALITGIRAYNQLADRFRQLRESVRDNTIKQGTGALQKAYLEASCMAPERMLPVLDDLLALKDEHPADDGVPVYLFGNMLPDIDAMDLFAECGARIIVDDLCTGSRMFPPITVTTDAGDDLLHEYARELMNRPACARTMNPARPGKLAADIVADAGRCRAKGVIGHTVKFCDPYLARLPGIRAELKKEGIPFLLLEGDCTVRSMGQQKTRIEAFIEMLR
ncbi:MAG: 2-hydroxyacyl-CoA dehydratase family protein [Thermodesulfobacteriota bacterium]